MEIPEEFARRTIEREGDPARSWIAALPGLVDELLRQWRCTPAAPITRGGVGVVVDVRRENATPAVLKVSFPHPGNRFEAHAFATWAGRGAVRLYARDDERFALLLEQAHWDTIDTRLEPDDATAVAGDLARRLAVPGPPGLPRLSDRAGEWDRDLRADDELLGRPLSRRAQDAALATVRDFARRQPETMVHGDLHFGNIVAAGREPWLVVDPKGYVGDPAYDSLTVLVRAADSLYAATDPRAELRRRLAIFADAAGLERERVERWAQLQFVMGAHRTMRRGAPADLVAKYREGSEALV